MNISFFLCLHFTKITTAVKNMANKDLHKKQLRISSSGTDIKASSVLPFLSHHATLLTALCDETKTAAREKCESIFRDLLETVPLT